METLNKEYDNIVNTINKVQELYYLYKDLIKHLKVVYNFNINYINKSIKSKKKLENPCKMVLEKLIQSKEKQINDFKEYFYSKILVSNSPLCTKTIGLNIYQKPFFKEIFKEKSEQIKSILFDDNKELNSDKKPEKKKFDINELNQYNIFSEMRDCFIHLGLILCIKEFSEDYCFPSMEKFNFLNDRISRIMNIMDIIVRNTIVKLNKAKTIKATQIDRELSLNWSRKIQKDREKERQKNREKERQKNTLNIFNI